MVILLLVNRNFYSNFAAQIVTWSFTIRTRCRSIMNEIIVDLLSIVRYVFIILF